MILIILSSSCPTHNLSSYSKYDICFSLSSTSLVRLYLWLQWVYSAVQSVRCCALVSAFLLAAWRCVVASSDSGFVVMSLFLTGISVGVFGIVATPAMSHRVVAESVSIPGSTPAISDEVIVLSSPGSGTDWQLARSCAELSKSRSALI